MLHRHNEWTREEETRRAITDVAIRAAKRPEEGARHTKEREEKPLTEKVKEVVDLR